jgi:uncharacterized protein YuzB (UPF0349 family)
MQRRLINALEHLKMNMIISYATLMATLCNICMERTHDLQRATMVRQSTSQEIIEAESIVDEGRKAVEDVTKDIILNMLEGHHE